MPTRSTVLLLLFLTAAPAGAAEAATVRRTVEYYEVSGLTEAAIARSLLTDAPATLEGFQGLTTFWFEWTFNYGPATERNEAGLCRITAARTNIEIVVHLPRHPTIADAPDDVEATWTRFITAMERHERNHADDFVAVGRRIPKALEGVIGPCDGIEEAGNAKGMEYVALAQKAADDYDAATNHGETEGTFFPGL